MSFKREQPKLSDHFDCARLIRFVLPSVVMMIFTSIYGVVDGFFVSNFVGKTAFAAVNIVLPISLGLASIGFMIGSGGCAIVSKTLGEGDKEKANRIFSMLIYAVIIGGIVLTIPGFIFMRPIIRLMGADESLVADSVLYGRILLFFQTAYMLQSVFQSLFAAAEKPKLGLFITVAAGLTNMVLDALFIAVFRWGLAGAAAATVLGQIVGGVIPIVYFARKNTSLLSLVPTRFDGRVMLKVCTNGSSELMTNISISLVSLLYNIQLLSKAGNDGVAAYGVIMYVNFIFVAIFLGYSIGSAPVIGYNYGCQNKTELKNVFKKSVIIIGVLGIVLTCIAEAIATPLSRIFVGYDPALFEMTKRGFYICSLAFLICGFNIFGSAFFTALSNGLVSALISFARTLVFQVAAIMILPVFFDLDGIWLSVFVAEIPSFAVVLAFVFANRKRYEYM